MDFKDFAEKYNSGTVNTYRQAKLSVSNDIEAQKILYMEHIIRECKDKIFDYDYPLVISAPDSFVWTYSSDHGFRVVSIAFKKKAMLAAVEELNQKGWSIKIKWDYRYFPIDLEDRIKHRDKVNFRCYKLIIRGS